jgi:hypothetical protein
MLRLSHGFILFRCHGRESGAADASIAVYAATDAETLVT